MLLNYLNHYVKMIVFEQTALQNSTTVVQSQYSHCNSVGNGIGIVHLQVQGSHSASCMVSCPRMERL